MWRLYIILVVIGVALASYGVREYMLGKDSSAEPEAITIEELEKSGVPTNPYRKLGPHVGVMGNVVFNEEKRNGSNSVTSAYYAVVSVRELADAMKQVRLP